MTILAVVGVVVPVGWTADRIARRVRTMGHRRLSVRTLRDFADAFSRELEVGARPVDAARHAVDSLIEPAGLSGMAHRRQISSEMVSWLQLRVSLVGLGDIPGAALRPQRQGKGSCRHKSREAPDRPQGAEDAELSRLCAVWATAQRHGMATGRMMDQVRIDLDARLVHLGHTSSALAGARLTETILLLLPIGALGIGESMGVHPGAFLFGNALGVLLLVFGVLLGCAGALWTETLTVTVLGGVGRRAGPSALQAARTLDIFAEALLAGLPLTASWAAAVECQPACDDNPGAKKPRRIRRSSLDVEGTQEIAGKVAALLNLGTGASAWSLLRGDPALGPVARILESGVRSGARLADGIRIHATRLRQEEADRALAGAERVLVVVAAPLTLCFLPAFVLLGLIPLVVGFAGL